MDTNNQILNEQAKEAVQEDDLWKRAILFCEEADSDKVYARGFFVRVIPFLVGRVKEEQAEAEWWKECHDRVMLALIRRNRTVVWLTTLSVAAWLLGLIIGTVFF